MGTQPAAPTQFLLHGLPVLVDLRRAVRACLGVVASAEWMASVVSHLNMGAGGAWQDDDAAISCKCGAGVQPIVYRFTAISCRFGAGVQPIGTDFD